MALGPGTVVLVTGTSAKAVVDEAPGEESLPGALVVAPPVIAGACLEAKLNFANNCSLDNGAGTGEAGTTGEAVATDSTGGVYS